jgi:trans-aconitate methyltransferase
VRAMPEHPSHRRRELAAQCLTFAEQTSDLNVRAKLVAMAQKWLDLADDEFGSHELDAWNKTFYHRAIQTKIGQTFRARQ